MRSQQLRILSTVFFWTFIASVVGVLAGSASALFLWLLDWATATRESHLWLIALLPLAGLLTGYLYHTIGKSIEAGNNLIIDEIHEPHAPIPFRMAPLILFATILTHLFGGSAGREGTAVQMGGGLADQLSVVFQKWPFRALRLHIINEARNRRILLMAGLSAGFGSIFGTPIAGAIFGLEVLSIGRMDYEALLPCFIASIIGDLMTQFWGIHHVSMAGLVPDVSVGPVTVLSLVLAAVAGTAFGVIGMLFAKASHATEELFKSAIKHGPLRPFIGGIIVAAMVYASGTTRYIGLGTTIISESFQHPLLPWDFAGKFVFTVLTLNSGFKGGEVTPLFYIGATLGNALSYVLPLPLPVLAAMGFVSVFAGAANVPLTCILMATEMFGSQVAVFAAVACVASYLVSGHTGIYHSQRVALRKVRV
jgi:H+/Cl- antiporter ClcA